VVSFTFSEKLKNSDMLFYNVSEAKIVNERGEPKVKLVISAKNDFTIPSMKAYDYTIYYHLMGSKGALKNSTSTAIPVSLSREAKSFKAGEALSEIIVEFYLKNYAADRVDFSSIEFITQEEYNAMIGL
jgi:hypothetical protein